MLVTENFISTIITIMNKVLFFISLAIILSILLKYYVNLSEDILYVTGGEFKKEPEISIESTILHKEKEVYDHLLSPSNNLYLHFSVK